MVKADRIKWEAFKAVKKTTITHEEYEMVCQFHAKYFNHKIDYPCKCSPKRINSFIADLNNL